jgi:hypothetical protein
VINSIYQPNVIINETVQHRVNWTLGILRDLQVFSGFGVFLFASLVHTRLHAGNASRWVASQENARFTIDASNNRRS